MKHLKSVSKLAEAGVTLRKYNKIAVITLTPTLNQTQTLNLALTLTLIKKQNQKGHSIIRQSRCVSPSRFFS